MNKETTRIYVNNDLDIILARMQTRSMAKEMGFNTADQARISLAASELAKIITWTRRGRNEIIISNTAKNGHRGLQVACLVQQKHIFREEGCVRANEEQLTYRSFLGACRLVDESTIEPQDDLQAQVTLIKWLK